MTKALELAKECGYQHPDVISICSPFAHFDLERYYARAQAQALRVAANKFRGDIGYNFVAADGYSSAQDIATELDFMADELERKA